MRSVLYGFFLALLASFSASAGVLYSFSQPASPPGVYPWPAINFEFTAPSLLTSATVIPGSEINAPIIPYMGFNQSILSVTIDPNGSSTSYVGSSGVGFIGIQMGTANESLMGEGVCFDSNVSCYSTLNAIGAQAFDHLGTYTSGDVTLTISSTDPAPAAVPEPRFEALAGLLALLTGIAFARRATQLRRAKLAS